MQPEFETSARIEGCITSCFCPSFHARDRIIHSCSCSKWRGRRGADHGRGKSKQQALYASKPCIYTERIWGSRRG